MTQETKLGLIVGLGFIAVFAWLLDDVQTKKLLTQRVPAAVSGQALNLFALLLTDLAGRPRTRQRDEQGQGGANEAR